MLFLATSLLVMGFVLFCIALVQLWAVIRDTALAGQSSVSTVYHTNDNTARWAR
jgi:hypothetical protein